MTIEELKALCETEWDAPEPYDKDRPYSEHECDYLNASKVLWDARREILALVEAINGCCFIGDASKRGYVESDDDVWDVLNAFNAKLASL